MLRRELFAAAPAAAFALQNPLPKGAIIGSGGRGTFLTGEFKEVGAQVAAVCDVYEPNLERGLKAASTGAASYRDYRRLLEDKSLEFVIVATPDHWHARMVIDAVEAGKDVYVEKPLAHTIEEGERIIAAVKRTNRIVQVGTQRRSSDLFLEAKRLFDEQRQGPVRLVNAWWMNHTVSLPDKALAGSLDWKQWLGNAPTREVDAHRFFNWYYYWDYSGGLMVGQAAHMVDLILWFMNAGAPSAVTAVGTRPNLERVEVPETTCLTMECEKENFLAVFNVGYKSMRYNFHMDQLAKFHGHRAEFHVGREHYAVYPEDPQARELKAAVENRKPGSFSSATRQHIRNFLECIRTRQQPNATVEIAQRTNIGLAMAMESLRTGQRIVRRA